MIQILLIIAIIILTFSVIRVEPEPSIEPYLGLKGSFIPETISEPVDIRINLEIVGYVFIPMKKL